MVKANEPWLEIDIKGFAQVLRNKGIARIALEPISNALDTDAGEIEVTFTQSNGWATLDVSDDDPDGFADLRESYTMFAPSRRREDPTKRGRFGQGEKELIAICATGGDVEVASTTGTVLFRDDGRHVAQGVRTEAGTTLTARFRCNQREAKEFVALVGSLLVPDGIKLVYNGTVVPQRTPRHTATASLATKIIDSDGNLADATRSTTVSFYEPLDGERPTIYELGVPVVVHDGRWHVDVGQKVPLNAARDNVNPAYLRRLRELMLNETFADLTSVDCKRAWVADALPKASDEALRDVVEKIHGPGAVIFDPSNPEASKRAVDQGRTVVYGRQFSADTWTRIKDAEILKPAGQVIETGVPSTTDGIPPIPEAKWTPAMTALAEYAKDVGHFLLGFVPEVEYANIAVGTRAEAWYGGRRIAFNLGRLGKRWPETATPEAVDALLIHEYAHEIAGDHFSDRYIEACCDFGARLRDCPHTWGGAG